MTNNRVNGFIISIVPSSHHIKTIGLPERRGISEAGITIFEEGLQGEQRAGKGY